MFSALLGEVLERSFAFTFLAKKEERKKERKQERKLSSNILEQRFSGLYRLDTDWISKSVDR